jgi:hypothetical protein
VVADDTIDFFCLIGEEIERRQATDGGDDASSGRCGQESLYHLQDRAIVVDNDKSQTFKRVNNERFRTHTNPELPRLPPTNKGLPQRH